VGFSTFAYVTHGNMGRHRGGSSLLCRPFFASPFWHAKEEFGACTWSFGPMMTKMKGLAVYSQFSKGMLVRYLRSFPAGSLAL